VSAPRREVVVTGGGRGIGRAIALRFAEAGARVFVNFFVNREAAEKTAREVELAGGVAHLVQADVKEPAEIRRMFAEIATVAGRLDVLVNNAAFQMSYESFLDIPPDELDFVFRTNVLAMFHLCQAAVPAMEPGSTILNTTSIQAAQPSPQLLHYAASKGAISTFTKGLAQEVAERGIRVNAIAPGPIWTPLVVMSFPAEKNAQFGSDTPLGRPGQPGELAPLYVFLATEDSRYISGEVIGATGGKPLH